MEHTGLRRNLSFDFFRLQQRPLALILWIPSSSPSTDPTSIRGFAGKIIITGDGPDSNRGACYDPTVLSPLYSLAMAGKVTNT